MSAVLSTEQSHGARLIPELFPWELSDQTRSWPENLIPISCFQAWDSRSWGSPGVVTALCAQGSWGWKKPWGSRVLLEIHVECLSLTKGWQSLPSVAETWSSWEKSWIVWLVPFEMLMEKCFLQLQRFLFSGWTVHGTQVLQQKLTVKSEVACG